MPHMIVKDTDGNKITSYTDKDLREGDTVVAAGLDEDGQESHVRLVVDEVRLIQGRRLKTGVDCDTVEIHFDYVTPYVMEALLRGGRWREKK